MIRPPAKRHSASWHFGVDFTAKQPALLRSQPNFAPFNTELLNDAGLSSLHTQEDGWYGIELAKSQTQPAFSTISCDGITRENLPVVTSF